MAEVRINADIVLVVREGAPLARLARLSPHQVLRTAARALDGVLARSSPISDWLGLAIEACDQDTVTDVDSLFIDYHRFSEVLKVGISERLPHAAFVRALRDRGMAISKSDRGRLLCPGVRLRDCQFDTLAGPPVADLTPFLAECCQRHDKGSRRRARSTDLHAAYQAWAARRSAPQLTLRQFAAAMRSAGFERFTSNGAHWRGVTLTPPVPAPPAVGAAPSGVEMGAKLRRKTGGAPELPGL